MILNSLLTLIFDFDDDVDFVVGYEFDFDFELRVWFWNLTLDFEALVVYNALHAQINALPSGTMSLVTKSLEIHADQGQGWQGQTWQGWQG